MIAWFECRRDKARYLLDDSPKAYGMNVEVNDRGELVMSKEPDGVLSPFIPMAKKDASKKKKAAIKEKL